MNVKIPSLLSNFASFASFSLQQKIDKGYPNMDSCRIKREAQKKQNKAYKG